MSKFYMMIGLPGSGKSTYAEELSKKTGAKIYSTDNFRKSIFGNERIYNYEKDKCMFEFIKKLILIDLQNGVSVIYDATNISSKNRKDILSLIGKTCKKEAIVFATHSKICIERQNKRTVEDKAPKVPEDRILYLAKTFNMPSFKEGFDSIDIIQCENNLDYLPTFRYLRDFEQCNSHHNTTLGDHLFKTVQYIRKNFSSVLTNKELELMTVAGAYHDIGKPDCMFFDESDGSDDAHFWGHAGTSSLYFVCFLDKDYFSISDICFICFIIENHMKVIESERKIYKKFTEREIELLKMFQLADKNRYYSQFILFSDCKNYYDYYGKVK